MKNKIAMLCATFLLWSGCLWAQSTLKVSGTVVSKSDNLPIIGASVVETDKPTNGAATDIDGNFYLTVADGATITVSYIGYKSVTLPAEATMQITLDENNELLDEVVVTGYTTQRKADLTGSVAVVNTDDLKTTADPDPMRALQGKVPGMTITATGSPSGVGTVRIRGIGSFNSSQDPLYIVDGVPTTRALNSLNANDIESMQVLKDAASASIYGSRASNGVIIITTKRGKKGDKIKVDFSANLTASFYSGQSKMKLLNSAGYATAMAQAALNDGIDPVAYASNYGLNLNATGGTPITVWNPATSQYVNYTVGGLYDGLHQCQPHDALFRHRLARCHIAHRLLTKLRLVGFTRQRQAFGHVLARLQEKQRYHKIHRLPKHLGPNEFIIQHSRLGVGRRKFYSDLFKPS